MRMLLTPGPVEVPFDVSIRGSMRMISHRGPEFSSLYSDLLHQLSRLFEVEEPPIPIPGSGTGALDALCGNLISPGDRVISISCGFFGERFREIASRCGASLEIIDVPWGESLEVHHLLEALERFPNARAILLTHNETSTGVLNPVEDLAGSVPKDGPLILLDAVSSAGAMPCLPERWGIDGVAASSQKGLMAPPGVGLVWLSKRAWSRAQEVRCPSYSMDLKLYKKNLTDAPETPYTPPVSLYAQLLKGVEIILSSGKEEWWKSRARISRALCAAVEAMGLDLLVKSPNRRSPGLTAIKMPPNLANGVRSSLKGMGLQVAGGQGGLKDSLIRIAHYTDMDWPEVCMIIGSLWRALNDLGVRADVGCALETANKIMSER
ncbi:serine-pyruvate aminotransferase/archaeal aspartate aminotransferase [Thermanaerovibrio velox DSM 12556]|uniref:Serine-pyruvate aminotransferase/archaeal aspartate aminotransferase n=2 Tax=Thermanaerovibrio TaxID=81461 RepID=H0URU8_9BACT|nr:serine-pyruvate aminotransferase/archaeal aspartate aminotransferase [Thermanaerovibrio velox DSM 12556]